MPEPMRILVVCTANICRSPATATLLRRELGGVAEVEVTSAGVAAIDGSPACDLSSALVDEVVTRHRAGGSEPGSAPTHAARRVSADQVADADLILVLDRSHRAALARLAPASRSRTFTLRQAARLARNVRGHLEAAGLPAAAPPLPPAPRERLDWFVAELDAARGTGESGAEQPPGLDWHDDVPDPHVVGYQIHPMALELIEQCVGELTTAVAAVLAAPESAGSDPAT